MLTHHMMCHILTIIRLSIRLNIFRTMRQTIVLITVMIFQMGFDAESKKETESLSFFCIYYIFSAQKKDETKCSVFCSF